MTGQHSARPEGRPAADRIASLTLMLVAALALGTAWFLPWWIMEARAPQYGQRVLVVRVSPRVVSGDVFEVDSLGHYVGIKPMASLATLERSVAPFGLLAAILGVLLTPWVRSRRLRVLFVLPALVMPVLFLADLAYWVDRSVNDRDPGAALNLTVTSIDAKLLGKYAVGQFQVHAKAESGLYLAGAAGLLAAGLAFSVPMARPRRSRPGAGRARIGPALLLAALGGVPAGAAERVVAPGDSIASSIASARPGDTIRVARGTYREHLTIDKAVRLVGEEGAVLDGGGQGTVVTVRAPGVELRNLVIRGSGDRYTSEDAAVRLDEEATGTRIVESRLEDCLFGVFAVRAHGCEIARSTIVGKDLPSERRGDAIRLLQSHDCRIVENTVERSRDLIIWYSSGTDVEGNVVRHGRYGLHYMYSDRNRFRRNRFEDNEVGASIMYSRGIELRENSFSFSTGPSAYGLLVKESNDVFIHDNRFVGNATALFFDDSPQARDARGVVEGNLIARNQVGVALQPLTRRIEFSGNAFIGNRTSVAVIGTGSASRCSWSVGGRGNYWSEAMPFDRDGDGVSDIPYRLESTYEVLAARRPVLAFYDDTPAAQAIDLASRLFPIFSPRPVLTDERPLVEAPVADWMHEPEGKGAGKGLLGAGAGCVALASVLLAGTRRILA